MKKKKPTNLNMTSNQVELTDLNLLAGTVNSSGILPSTFSPTADELAWLREIINEIPSENESSDFNIVASRQGFNYLNPSSSENDRLFFDAEQKDEELIAKIKAQPNFFLLINILPWDETFADGTTLLWKAARNNRWGLMKFLFEHKVDVNKADNEGQTPLMTAVTHNYLSLVLHLVFDRHASLEAKDKGGGTALYHAIVEAYGDDVELSKRTSFLEIARHLIWAGADVRTVGDKAPDLACRYFSQLELVRISENYSTTNNKGGFIGHYPLAKGKHKMVALTKSTKKLFEQRRNLRGFMELLKEREGGYYDDVSALWRDHCIDKKITPQYADAKVAFFLLPIPIGPQLLEACCACALKDGDFSIFSNMTVSITVDRHWKSSLPFFMWSIGWQVIYRVLLSITVYTFHDGVSSPERSKRNASWFVVYFLFALTILFSSSLLFTLWRLAHTARPFDYFKFSTLFYVVDVLGMLFMWIGLIQRIVHGHPTGGDFGSTSTLSVGVVFVWLKSLYYMRPFRETGYLIKVVNHIMRCTLSFMLVLLLILLGFSQALFLLSYENTSLPFGFPGGSLLSAYEFMLGQSDLQNVALSTNPDLATVLIVAQAWIATIVLLNLLIALMNEAFMDIKADTRSSATMERAIVVLDQQWANEHFFELFRALMRRCGWSGFLGLDTDLSEDPDNRTGPSNRFSQNSFPSFSSIPLGQSTSVDDHAAEEAGGGFWSGFGRGVGRGGGEDSVVAFCIRRKVDVQEEQLESLREGRLDRLLAILENLYPSNRDVETKESEH